jgi:hypothetical protein
VDRVETPIGEMWLDERGVRWHRITTQERITVDDAAAVQRIAAELTDGEPAPAVVDIRSVSYAAREARDTFGDSFGSDVETATALVVGSSASLTMARAFISITKPERPVAVFTSEAKALEWAVRFLPDSPAATES